MMRIAILLSSILLCSAVATAEQRLVVSLAKDQALAVYALDTADGTLGLKSKTETPGQPGAMCLDADGKHLYVSLRKAGRLAAYRVSADGQLTPLGDVDAHADPSYLTVDPRGKFLLSAYYAVGKVTVHAIRSDGSIAPSSVQTLETDERAHAAVFDRSGRYVFVPHTRPNSIFQFAFDSKSGMLQACDPPKLVREADSGPRHLWFGSDNRFAYGSDEQGNSLTVYALDESAGTLAAVQTLSSIPEGSESKSTADVEVHPSGKFVYIANRGHNSIAGFRVDSGTGRVKSIGHASVAPVPRSFNISPDGNFLVAAGQTSATLKTFRIDDGGGLHETQTLETGDGPWWVQFLPAR